jgi:LacI family transcriptional regulator
MRRHGLDEYMRVTPGDYTEEAGIRSAHTLLAADQRATGTVAVNDRCAIGLLDALVRAGTDVPRSMSVVGYDDTAFSRLAYINLTTVSQEPRQQAQHAVAAAIDRLDRGRTNPTSTVLRPRLVIRGTTGAVPKSPDRKASIQQRLTTIQEEAPVAS